MWKTATVPRLIPMIQRSRGRTDPAKVRVSTTQLGNGQYAKRENTAIEAEFSSAQWMVTYVTDRNEDYHRDCRRAWRSQVLD